MLPLSGSSGAGFGTQSRHGKHRFSRSQRRTWVVLGSALIAPLAGASPIGSDLLDWAWAAGLAALAAYLATTAKRGPLLVAAVLVIVSARSMPAVGFAGIAVVAAYLSTRNLRRRSVFTRGAAGGATMISLLANARHISALHVLLVSIAVAAAIGASSLRNMRSADRRRSVLIGAGACGLFALAGVAAALGVAQSANLVDIGTMELRAGLASARQGDAAGSAGHLDRAHAALAQAHDRIDRWGLGARVVPIAAQHVSAVTSVLGAVEEAGTQAGETAGIVDTGELAPKAGRVDLEAVASLANPLGRLAQDLHKVVDEVDRRASGPILPALEHRLDVLRAEASRAEIDARSGSDAARVLPAVLGRDRTRHYLVLFTSPAEARGRFGFPGSFAEVTFDKGRMLLGEHGSTVALLQVPDADQRAFDLGDPLLRPYVPYAVTRTVLSVTAMPDFRTVATAAAELWKQSGRAPVDGVLRFDPAALAPLLTFTGPVTVPSRDQPLTADNLVEYLLVGQYVQFPDLNAQAPRREVLGAVADETFDRLQTADLPSPRALVDLFAPLVRQGHLDMVTFGKGELAFLDRVGLSGRLAVPTSDSILVTNVNGLGNKIDSLLSKTVTYKATVDGGQLTGTLRVAVHNAAPSKNLPFYVIGSTLKPEPPRGTNRTTVFVYTSVPATEILVDGRPVEALSQRTGGRWLHQVVVEVPPGGTGRIEMTLKGDLPDGAGGAYHLDLEPGGGTSPDDYAVEVTHGGKTSTRRGRVATLTVVR